MEEPRLIEGGLSVDDRGEVAFVNGFDFAGVKRFYMVSNHHSGFVRAWHAHRREAKFVMAISGVAMVGAVELDDWENPSKAAKVWKFILSSVKPSVLFIPAGYANGFMSLSDDAKLAFFSTASLEDSLGDDFRYDARYWDIWKVEER